MGRPKKEGAEYFPHLTSNGKTIFTLESMYGNDGYAFWFKLLEILCSTEGHYFCTRKPPEWLFLVSKTRVSEETATAILKTLADLEAIDPELWAEGVIWCGKLVDNLRPVYAKRKTETPPRPVFLVQKVQQNGVSGAESTQRKEKESREKESREKESREKDTPPTPQKGAACPYQEIVATYHEQCPDLPRVNVLTPSLEKNIKARWQEQKARQDITWWQEYFAQVAASDYLTGRIKDWTASFQWLMGPVNMTKVLNGAYQNKRSQPLSSAGMKTARAAQEWLAEREQQRQNGEAL